MLNDPRYRASKYPYFIPDKSYVMDHGEYTLVDHDDLLDGLNERTPVLAVGSNLSPQQLARKFPVTNSDTDNTKIPVTKILLRDFDSVYSTHFANYGSIPATLYPAPNTEVSLFVNWLNDAQLQTMHKTEIPSENYHFCRLNNINAIWNNAPARDHIFVYLSSRGAVNIDGNPVPLAEIKAQNRTWQALTQLEIQDHARRIMAQDLTLSDFMFKTINDGAIRHTRTSLLNANVIKFQHKNMDILET